MLHEHSPQVQQRWVAWRRRQDLEDRLPQSFTEVLAAVTAFADPALTGGGHRPSLEYPDTIVGLTDLCSG